MHPDKWTLMAESFLTTIWTFIAKMLQGGIKAVRDMLVDQSSLIRVCIDRNSIRCNYRQTSGRVKNIQTFYSYADSFKCAGRRK